MLPGHKAPAYESRRTALYGPPNHVGPLRAAYFFGGIGVSQPAMSDGFAPFTWPPKLNVDG